MVLHMDETVALKHAQGLANGHLADLEFLRECAEAQAAVGLVQAPEDAGAQLFINPVRLRRERAAADRAALFRWLHGWSRAHIRDCVRIFDMIYNVNLGS